MSDLRFTCTALTGMNKQGILRPQQDGYYEVVLAALNFPNPRGDRYTLSSAHRILAESSDFTRRIREGNLRGENGHPKRESHMSDAQFLARCHDIYEPRISHHIREVWIDETGAVKNYGNEPVVAIMGLVKPCGEMGHLLAASFENRHENTCFSLRALTDCFRRPDGGLDKEFVNLVTFDWVHEPGLRPATKYSSPATESYTASDLIVDKALVAESYRVLKSERMSFESASSQRFTETLEMAERIERKRLDLRVPMWMKV